MIETIVIICLIGFIIWLEWSRTRERRYLTNLIVARTPAEARILNEEFTRPVPARIPDPVEILDGFDGPVGI